MMKSYVQVALILLLQLLVMVSGELCRGGHSCRKPQRCCSDTCCLPDHYQDHYHGFGFRWSIWNMWFIVIFILMSCFGGCGYWRRRQLLLAQHQQTMMNHYDNYHTPSSRTPYSGPHLTMPVFPTTYDASIFGGGGGGGGVRAVGGGGGGGGGGGVAGYNRAEPPPDFFPSPPPYSEVMSKPDVWPPGKDELPPYPGEPVITADHGQALPDHRLETLEADGTVPGLPPYSSIDTPQNASQGVYTIANHAVRDTTVTCSIASRDAQSTAQSVSPRLDDNHHAVSSSSNDTPIMSNQVNVRNGQDVPSCVPDVHT